MTKPDELMPDEIYVCAIHNDNPTSGFWDLHYGGTKYTRALTPSNSRALEDVMHWAQAVLTALNVGDIRRDSLLHHKLRQVMIEYRRSLTEGDEK